MDGKSGEEPSTILQEPAVLTQNEALENLLEDNADVMLSNWSIEDLTALFGQIIKHRCDRASIERFSTEFKNTTPNDIEEVIQYLRNLNYQANDHRFRFNKSEEPILVERPPPQNTNNFSDWFSVATQIVKIRKIGDETTGILTKILADVKIDFGPEGNVPISNSPYAPSNNLLGGSDYEQIYQHLGALIGSRSLSRAKSLNASIILSIFDEMEGDLDKFPDLIEFFGKMFQDFRIFDQNDFKIDGLLNEENIPKAGLLTANLFGFPEKLFNLSEFLNEDEEIEE